MPAYQRGDFLQAENCLEQAKENKMPDDNYTNSKDAVWLLLNCATLYFAEGNFDEAIRNYRLALEALDYYNQTSPRERLAQVLLQDDMEAYCGSDFEQILARFYFALALLSAGDENNAFALLRQAEDVQQKKREMYCKDRLTQDYIVSSNAAVKFLLAAISEYRGDISNANILYKQIEEMIGKNLSDLQLRPQNEDKNCATVIIVVHNGNAPYKISSTSGASIASFTALEIMLGKCTPPAISMLIGIPVPVLMQQIFSTRYPVFTRLCRQEREVIPLYNVAQAAAIELKQQLPIIVARGVARLAIRQGAVAYCNEKNPYLSAMANLGMTIANSCTQADTRTWSTLPNTIDVARYEIPAGDHTLHLQTCWGVMEASIGEFPLNLKPHDFCVINVFNIHPGIAIVQVPKKYK